MSEQARRFRPSWSLILLAVNTVILSISALRGHLYSNLGLVVVNKALWTQEQRAVDRQKALRLAARLYEAALVPSGEPIKEIKTTGFSMIPAVIAAEDQRRQGMDRLAAIWLYRAATAPPCPALQHAILLPGWAQLTRDGAITLDGVTPPWTLRRDAAIEAKVETLEAGGNRFSFLSEADARRAQFQWHQYLDIGYHHSAVMRSRVASGCVLHLETVVDGELIRHFAQQGTGKQETHKFDLQGHTLQYIYVLLDSVADSEDQEECVAEISPITFLPDKETVICAGDP